MKPSINRFNELSDMIVHKYERYLPNAFDESLSLLEKINKVIEYLNQIGKLSNEVVKQWNEVVEWILGEGLAETINDKLDLMATDGTLAKIINVDMMGSLPNLKTVNKDNLVSAINEVFDSVTNAITNMENDIAIVSSLKADKTEVLTLSSQKADKTQVTLLSNVKADKTYVDAGVNSLNSKINGLSSASPKGVYATLSALTNAFPTGNANIYVVSSDGNWYYWNGSAWLPGGIYQSTVLADKSVNMDKLAYTSLFKNLFDKTAITVGSYIDHTTGQAVPITGGYNASNFIPLTPGKTYTKNKVNQFAFYDEAKKYVSGLTDGTFTFKVPVGVTYVRFTVVDGDVQTFQLEEGSKQTNNSEYQLVHDTTTISRKDNSYTVANRGGNFNTINNGIYYLVTMGLIEHVTMQIYTGIYEEIIGGLMGDRKISLIGENKKACVVIDKSGNYFNSPLQIAGSYYIKNMSFISNHDEAEVLPQYLGYAMHSDYNYPGELVFEDCYFESQQNAAVGIGMFSNQTMIFRNCQFYKNSDYDGGCFYVHSAVGDNAVNQKILLINCEIISEQGIALKIDDANIGSGNGLGTDMEITFINCMIYSKTLGKECIAVNTPPLGEDKIAGNVRLGNMSYGNNISMLNA